jgi:hypothetical protein
VDFLLFPPAASSSQLSSRRQLDSCFSDTPSSAAISLFFFFPFELFQIKRLYPDWDFLLLALYIHHLYFMAQKKHP